MCTASTNGSFKEFAIELAQLSGDFIRPYFRSDHLSIELKQDRTIVTEADRGAEKLMREAIERRFPEHGILGEEYGPKNADAEYVWVLDPIDGTVSFAHGVPLFGTLIALSRRGQPVLGVIHQPILGELLIGDGTTTTLNGRPVHTRAIENLEEATVLCTDLKHVAMHQDAGRFQALIERTKLPRGWGDCYGYLLLASGRADVMCDPIMNPWDIAALVPVVRGAGGVITSWEGGEPVNAKAIIAAATPNLHAEVLGVLNGPREGPRAKPKSSLSGVP